MMKTNSAARPAKHGWDDMKTGARTNGPASLKVSFSQMVPVTQRGLVREVSAVLCAAEHRHDGHASALLKEVTREADASRTTLLVVVKPFDDQELSQEQLAAWYQRLGFVEIQARPCVMARSPRTIQ